MLIMKTISIIMKLPSSE